MRFAVTGVGERPDSVTQRSVLFVDDGVD